MKTRKVKVKTCPCGHEEKWHTGPNAACRYGKGHPMGGCKCLGFRSRRYGTGETLFGESPRLAHDALPPIPSDLHEFIGAAFMKMETEIRESMTAFETSMSAFFKKRPREMPSMLSAPRSRPSPSPPPRRPKTGGLNRCTLALLDVFAQWHPKIVTRRQACIIAGYRPSGGTSTAFSILQQAGYIEANNDGFVATHDGISRSSGKKLPKGSDLLSMWIHKLNTCTATILRFLYENSSKSFTRDEICRMTNYRPSGGTSTAFSTLSTLDLITVNRNKTISLNRDSGLL